MASPSPSTLPALYRHLLRTSRLTFQGDKRMLIAWRSFVRQRLPSQIAAANNQAGSTLPDEVLKEWLDVAKMLRMNVVQGIKDDSKGDVYQLRFTSNTELGTNDSIRKGREQQLADLKASKGVLGCGGTSSSRPTSSPSPSTSSARAFSTSARFAAPRDISKIKTPRPMRIPHPVPHFHSVTVLADGSSIQLTTTSPRSTNRLTRDTTNHPLWNPKMNLRLGGGDDDAGRMERFRKRFSEVQKEVQATDPSEQQQQQQDSDATASTPDVSLSEPKEPKKGSKRGVFSIDDLDWMSEGGRQALASSQPVRTKGGKGKK